MSTVVTSDKKEIGQLSQISYFEWTVEDILSHELVDCRCESPRFTFQNSQWYLCMYPNGQTKHNSAGWIGLYLMKEDDTEAAKSVKFSLGMKSLKLGVSKNAYRVVVQLEPVLKDCSWIYNSTDKGCGVPQFLMRSELPRRRTDLTPSGALTVTCSFDVNDMPVKNSIQETLSENFADLFLSKRDCDAVLKVQHQEFQVHKCILSARSTVFEVMFQADMKEKQTGIVDIEDCDPEAFRSFLLFLYSGKFQTNSCEVFELYKIADKYCVGELRSACGLYLMSDLSVDNVCKAAALADDFGDDQLQQATQLFFNDNFLNIFSTTDWVHFMKTNNFLANELLKKMASDKKL